MTKDTIVLGLGNPLMGDEGIGVKLIEILQSASGDFPGADFVDAGMGEPPGTIRRFTPEEVRTVKELAHVSLHEVDILNVIALARQLGECPEEIVFFGIEPESIEQRMALSETLGGRLKEYTEAISGELAAR